MSMTQQRDKVFMVSPTNRQHLIEIDLSDDKVKELKVADTKLEGITVDDSGLVYGITTDGYLYNMSWDKEGKVTLRSFKIKEGKIV